MMATASAERAMIESTTACDSSILPDKGWLARPRSATRRAILTAAVTSAAFLVIAADGVAAPDVLDPAATHTRLVVIRSGKEGQGRPIVALANPTCTNDPAPIDGTLQGILARELFRQAILIAARDELGLATRDEVLGDSPPAVAEGGPHVELVTVFRFGPNKPNQALIRRTDGANPEMLFKHDLPGQNRPWAT